MFQRRYAYICVIVALALALHGYENLTEWRRSASPGAAYWALGVFLWAMTPYALCAIVARLSVYAVPANVGISVAFLFDLGMHHEIAASTSSTRGLGYIFMPLWNLILLAPLSMLFIQWVLKKSRPNENAP